jgi:hypothetical protein
VDLLDIQRDSVESDQPNIIDHQIANRYLHDAIVRQGIALRRWQSNPCSADSNRRSQTAVRLSA